MATASETNPTKAVEPEASMAHEEKVPLGSSTHNDLDNDFQAYETRKIDLRTILGILVCPR